MIKLFRNIRQNLIMENKTTNYLKYAIGEIILVIIGILIALSINNWNEHRKLKIEEHNSLIDLRSEIVSNIEALTKTIVSHQKSYDVAKKLKDLFNDREAFDNMPDSIFLTNYLQMVNNATFDPKLGILKSLISSGKINTLSNKELLYSISSLEDEITDALEDQVKIDEQMPDYVRSIYVNSGVIIDGKFQGLDIKSRYEKPEFRIMVLMLYNTWRPNGLLEEQELLESFKHILALIDQEIKK
ncbi:DUF6090 family protein [Gaetbulibacter aquiaggeris]|uniref:DUF6090 family protein n=1 Tax=Gaetbulibacter aquiaggeris TaxID=1735373 RepID=A0ABW7MX61_9FLAO